MLLASTIFLKGIIMSKVGIFTNIVVWDICEQDVRFCLEKSGDNGSGIVIILYEV